MTTPPNRAVQFLAAFNDIEQFLRERQNARNSDSMRSIIRWAARDHLLTPSQADDLDEFADLRNAISHGSYTEDYRPIAEPLPETVAAIERIRDMLRTPPTALGVLGTHQVRTVAPSDDVHVALDVVRTTDISQLPVYEGSTYRGLLTTNVIARWVAADLKDNDRLDARKVSEVLTYAESRDHAVFLPRTATAQEALDALTQQHADETLPQVVIVTEHGKTTQLPLRIIGLTDLVDLVDALHS